MTYLNRALHIGAVSVASAVVSTIVFMSMAAAREYGILALYDVRNAKAFSSALQAFESDIQGRGCGLVRDGRIANENGDIDIARPNRFLLMTCTKPLLRDADGRSVFPRLNAGANRIALLEGEAARFPEEPATAPVSKRAYILKLSRYNNADPDARDRDLAGIRAAAKPRDGRWRREMTITVSHAVGMQTPNDVDVIFYDSPAEGQRFRKNNPDILRSVGAFNKSHLTAFVYYSGGADR